MSEKRLDYFMDNPELKSRHLRAIPTLEMYRFFPPEEEIITIDSSNPHKNYRYIFNGQAKTDFEKEKLSQFYEYESSKSIKINYPSYWHESDTMRILQAADFDIKKTYINIIENINWLESIPKTICDKTINISNYECCSFVIQENDETVYGFRQDAPLNGYGYKVNSQSWNGLNVLKQEIDTQYTYFFHCIITENGWVIGQGGSQYDSDSRSIEQIAGQIVVNNDIAPDYLRRVRNILAPYDYGHFFIKAPDGRYGISFWDTYLTGTLQVGQYMVIPNEIEYYVKGNYKDFASNPVDALIQICSYDESGLNRRNLMTYDYKVHDTVNGQYYGVDVYATNDNGRNVG